MTVLPPWPPAAAASGLVIANPQTQPTPYPAMPTEPALLIIGDDTTIGVSAIDLPPGEPIGCLGNGATILQIAALNGGSGPQVAVTSAQNQQSATFDWVAQDDGSYQSSVNIQETWGGTPAFELNPSDYIGLAWALGASRDVLTPPGGGAFTIPDLSALMVLWDANGSYPLSPVTLRNMQSGASVEPYFGTVSALGVYGGVIGDTGWPDLLMMALSAGATIDAGSLEGWTYERITQVYIAVNPE